VGLYSILGSRIPLERPQWFAFQEERAGTDYVVSFLLEVGQDGGEMLGERWAKVTNRRQEGSWLWKVRSKMWRHLPPHLLQFLGLW